MKIINEEEKLNKQIDLHEAFSTGDIQGVMCTFVEMDKEDSISISFTVHEMNGSKMIHATSDMVMKLIKQGPMDIDEVFLEIRENINDRKD